MNHADKYTSIVSRLSAPASSTSLETHMVARAERLTYVATLLGNGNHTQARTLTDYDLVADVGHGVVGKPYSDEIRQQCRDALQAYTAARAAEGL